MIRRRIMTRTRDGVDAEVGVCGRRPARSIPIVYNGDPFGTAAIALSLATNVFSTALIGFKMWQHRQFLPEHLGAGGSSTQVLKPEIMALLVESGMIYCLVWVEFLVYHLFSDMMPDINGGPWRAASFYHEACVGPIVAIYPMVVVFVALNQSQLERGLANTRHEPSVLIRAATSRSRPHTTSIFTRVLPSSQASGLVVLLFSPEGTGVGAEEAQEEGSVEMGAGVDSGPFSPDAKLEE